ncbi:hypothetical protein Q5M85_13725 [Paraclostridium bifermentans]|nr:hypothetical protein [Paraclostridium bifermentans]
MLKSLIDNFSLKGIKRSNNNINFNEDEENELAFNNIKKRSFKAFFFIYSKKNNIFIDIS